MILQALTTIIRAALAAGAGYLVQSGLLPEDMVDELIAAAMLLVTVGWSLGEKAYLDYKKRNQIKDAIENAPVIHSRDDAIDSLRDAKLIRK